MEEKILTMRTHTEILELREEINKLQPGASMNQTVITAVRYCAENEINYPEIIQAKVKLSGIQPTELPSSLSFRIDMEDYTKVSDRFMNAFTPPLQRLQAPIFIKTVLKAYLIYLRSLQHEEESPPPDPVELIQSLCSLLKSDDPAAQKKIEKIRIILEEE